MMWKVICSVVLISMVAGQDPVKQPTNVSVNNTTNAPTNATSASVNTIEDKKDDKAMETKSLAKESADEGTKDHPFNPSILVMRDGSNLGNAKYYFAILIVSSLSVISIIIFKALR